MVRTSGKEGMFEISYPALHKGLAEWAMQHDVTLNTAVEQAIRQFLENE